jgi:hypothetical protein
MRISAIYESLLHCNYSNIIIVYHQNYIIGIVVHINMAVIFYQAVINQIHKHPHKIQYYREQKKDGNEIGAL